MIRILIIKPGFGGGKDGSRFKMLDESDEFVLSMPEMPEPIRGDTVATGLEMLSQEIERFNPDILLFGSRGGIYASKFLQDSTATIKIPPLLALGALQTKPLCEAYNGGLLALFCHGTKDDRNTIDRVRIDCHSSKVAELVEMDDFHDLRTLDSSAGGELLVGLLKRLHQRAQNKEILSNWKETERPKWISSVLEPKMHAFEMQARNDREKAMLQSNVRSGLLGELKLRGNHK